MPSLPLSHCNFQHRYVSTPVHGGCYLSMCHLVKGWQQGIHVPYFISKNCNTMQCGITDKLAKEDQMAPPCQGQQTERWSCQSTNQNLRASALAHSSLRCGLSHTPVRLGWLYSGFSAGMEIIRDTQPTFWLRLSKLNFQGGACVWGRRTRVTILSTP